MPLTAETAADYSQRSLAKLNEHLQKNMDEFMKRDMTQPSPNGPNEFDDFELVRTDAQIVSDMGYSYAATLRKIVQNRAALASGILGDVFIDMATRAQKVASRARSAELIDDDTAAALREMHSQ